MEEEEAYRWLYFLKEDMMSPKAKILSKLLTQFNSVDILLKLAAKKDYKEFKLLAHSLEVVLGMIIDEPKVPPAQVAKIVSNPLLWEAVTAIMKTNSFICRHFIYCFVRVALNTSGA
jgi:hypothetical protein